MARSRMALLVCSALAILSFSATAARPSFPHVALAGEDDPKPRFYKRFNIEFNETSYTVTRRRTQGKWWYDSTTGQEVVTRQDGRGDRYCASIHPWTNTPCTHLVTGGNRYIIFPQRSECCLCCNAAEGCGVLSPHWLVNSTFQGEVELNGVQSYKWFIQGLQPNYWFATADEQQLPVELDMWPNLYTSYHTDTFATSPIDPSLLEVPANCHSKCPVTSVCTFIRAGAALAHSARISS